MKVIAVGKAHDILIENNDILDSRRGLIDIEPYGSDWACGDIPIIVLVTAAALPAERDPI